jgi:MFS family permease
MLKDSFYRKNFNLLFFGIIFTFFSAFGQTFMMSLYVPSIQKYFNLSDGQFSSIYAAATLSSAFTLTWAGRFIDKVRLNNFAIFVMLGLSFSLILISQAYYLPVLFIAIYGLRLFGQGLMIHTSLTSMSKFFTGNRGKAISFASLGHSLSEAIFPTVIVLIIINSSWRISYLSSAAMVLVFIPIVFYLLIKKSNFTKKKLLIPLNKGLGAEDGMKIRELLRSKPFWMMIPTGFVTVSIATAILFFQLKFGEYRQWSETWIAACFIAYAIGNFTSTILGGWLTDIFGARRLFCFYPLPIIIGVIAVLVSTQPYTFIFLIGGVGASGGFGNTFTNAGLAEIYGTASLGTIRSFYITIIVVSTAVGPILVGQLLDHQFNFDQILQGSLVVLILFSLNAFRMLGLK